MESIDTKQLVCYSYNSYSGLASSASATTRNYKPDLIRLLSMMQHCKVDLLPLISQERLENLGRGASGIVRQSPVKIDMGFAFKRYRGNGLSQEHFGHIMSEVLILSQPPIREHPNIIDLEGVCLEVDRQTEQVIPVLVFEKAAWDLKMFMETKMGKGFSLHQRLELCRDVAGAISAIHAYSKLTVHLPHCFACCRDTYYGTNFKRRYPWGYQATEYTGLQRREW